jgi:hypothetical protein
MYIPSRREAPRLKALLTIPGKYNFNLNPRSIARIGVRKMAVGTPALHLWRKPFTVPEAWVFPRPADSLGRLRELMMALELCIGRGRCVRMLSVACLERLLALELCSGRLGALREAD